MDPTAPRSLTAGIERQIRDDRAQALARVTAAYEHLADAVVVAARARGWLGGDPNEAVRVLCAADPALAGLGPRPSVAKPMN
jgi:hypothetical protein